MREKTLKDREKRAEIMRDAFVIQKKTDRIRNFELFKKALSDHPGLGYAIFFTFIFAIASIDSRFPFWACMLFPAAAWFAVLSSAWDMRHHYAESEDES